MLVEPDYRGFRIEVHAEHADGAWDGDHDGDIQAALLAGIRAKPPKSFPYLQLAYHYRVGKPKDTMDVNVTQPVVFECFEPEPTSDGKDEPSTPRSDALAAAGFDEAVLQAIRGTRGEPGVEVSR